MEYETFEEAENALKNMDGKELFDQKIVVDWAFRNKPIKEKKKNKWLMSKQSCWTKKIIICFLYYRFNLEKKINALLKLKDFQVKFEFKCLIMISTIN